MMPPYWLTEQYLSLHKRIHRHALAVVANHQQLSGLSAARYTWSKYRQIPISPNQVATELLRFLLVGVVIGCVFFWAWTQPPHNPSQPSSQIHAER